LEGSGAQQRNGIICGLTEEDCMDTDDGTLDNLCPAFLNYHTATPQQTKELKDVQERATALGVRHEFTLRKLYHVHEINGWNWAAASQQILASLSSYENRTREDTQMQEILNQLLSVPDDSYLEFWAALGPDSKAVSFTQPNPIYVTQTGTN
jgi:hypothetical protein